MEGITGVPQLLTAPAAAAAALVEFCAVFGRAAAANAAMDSRFRQLRKSCFRAILAEYGNNGQCVS